MIEVRDFPELFKDICITEGGYKGEKDYAEKYLGFNNYLTPNPTVTFELVLKDDVQMVNFDDWWKDELNNGSNPFLVETKLFGKHGTYGVKMTTPYTHTVKDGNVVKFSAEILFDNDTVDNTPPIVENFTVYVDQDSRDNFISLKATDIDNDFLEFSIVLPTAKGELAGSGSLMLYTPDNGYIGMDCFNYVASDRWSTSVTGTVTIDVGVTPRADFAVRYQITAPVRVSGNFHFDLGDGVIKRGTGGYLTPLNGDIITVYSNDHVIDERDGGFVENIIIDNWGERTDFSSFLKGMNSLNSFTHASAVGQCKGRIFSGMFWGCSVQYIQPFDTSNGEYFNDMYRESVINSIPMFDYTNGLYFQRMFMDSRVTNIRDMDTVAGQYFQDIFKNASDLVCLGGINTTAALNTGGMFDGATSLTEPNAVDQTNIKSGVRWIKSSPCLMTVDRIEENTVATCSIGTLDGTCTSSTTYTVHYSNEAAAPTFNWSVGANATITAGQGTDTVTVDVDGGDATNIMISCEVDDGVSTISSGDYSFTHLRDYTYLTLVLPKQYSLLNLRNYIDTNNPTNQTEVLVINNVTNGSIETGDLTGLNVKFITNSEIQGYRAGYADANDVKNRGLTITSPIQLINNGWIRGCGGAGGTGGKGADDTYTTNSDTTRIFI